MQTAIRARPNASSPSCRTVSPPIDRVKKANATTATMPPSSASLRSFLHPLKIETLNRRHPYFLD
ncbi:hypothetical protein D3C72_1141270 [compost metagenome]